MKGKYRVKQWTGSVLGVDKKQKTYFHYSEVVIEDDT